MVCGCEAPEKHPGVAVPKAGSLSKKSVSFLSADRSQFYYRVCLLSGKAFPLRAAMVSYALTRDLGMELGGCGTASKTLLLQCSSYKPCCPPCTCTHTALPALLAQASAPYCWDCGPRCLLLSEF